MVVRPLPVCICHYEKVVGDQVVEVSEDSRSFGVHAEIGMLFHGLGIGNIFLRRKNPVSLASGRLEHFRGELDEWVVQQDTRNVCYSGTPRMMPLNERFQLAVDAHEGNLRQPIISPKDRFPDTSEMLLDAAVLDRLMTIWQLLNRGNVVAIVPTLQ